MELKDITVVLEHMLLLLELKGESPFKIRALEQAVRLLAREARDTKSFIAELKAKRIKGFGPELTGYVLTLHERGTLPYYEELRAEFPDELFELFAVQGLGPKKIRALYQELGIASIAALKDACENRHVSALKGFGVKTEAGFLETIAQLEKYRGKLLLHRARALAAELVSYLQASSDVVEAAATGAIRRSMELIDCIELLAATDNEAAVRAYFLEHALIRDDSAAADGAPQAATLYDGSQCRLHICAPQDLTLRLWETTGSPEHLAAVERAAPRGKTAAAGPAENEPALYHARSLAWVPPEAREGMDEVETARALFARGEKAFTTVQCGQLRGVLHAHSDYSDGAVPLRELAVAVRDRGFEYLGISDHSRSAGYAGGLSIDRVKAQHEEVDRLNAELAPFVVFKGIESDILKDGSLDYPDEILAEFDFVIASVHSRHGLNEDLMTERIVRAVENPFTTILGHPSGRLLLRREAYGVAMERVLDSAVRHKVAVEINCNPRRLDLDWRYVRRMRDAGIMFPISPDAHSLGELDYLELGVLMAQKGGLAAGQVLNCLGAAELRAYFTRRKEERGHKGRGL